MSVTPLTPTVAATGSCGYCGYALNLSSSARDTEGIETKYRKQIRKGVVAFVAVDESRFTLAHELTCTPYFRSARSWGLFRRRSRLLYRKCGGTSVAPTGRRRTPGTPTPPASSAVTAPRTTRAQAPARAAAAASRRARRGTWSGSARCSRCWMTLLSFPSCIVEAGVELVCRVLLLAWMNLNLV